MTSTLSKYISIGLTALLLISVVVAALFYLGGDTDEMSGVPKFTDPVIYLTYIYFIIAAVMAIAFPIISIVTNIKSALSAIIGIGIIGVILVIGYFMSDGTLIEMPSTYSGGDNNPTTLKLTDTGLFALYILLFISILGILVTSVLNMFKK